MFRRLMLFAGLNPRNSSSRGPIHANSPVRLPRSPIEFKLPPMLETVHEVAIYLHRFHNLDLFQQGWYQIKISMRWEDSTKEMIGTPARVVQYEAPGVLSDDVSGVWRIDDNDHSFSTQPFQIKYARQDVLLSVMISFYLPLGKNEIQTKRRSNLNSERLSKLVFIKYNKALYERFQKRRLQNKNEDYDPIALDDLNYSSEWMTGRMGACNEFVYEEGGLTWAEIPSTSAVLLKFELMYAPILQNGHEMQVALNTSPAAVHEFRIPPKALLGLHSYCPVHFDAFHSVLVDLSVHVVFLKSGVQTPSEKVISLLEGEGENSEEHKQDLVSLNVDKLIKSLSVSCDLLLNELQIISKATCQAIEDLSDFDSTFDESKLVVVGENSKIRLEAGEAVGKFLSSLKKSNGFIDHRNGAIHKSLTTEELLYTFYLLGNRISFLWNAFLKFHRVNRTKIMEHLRDTWASDRKSEWSIWMVHSKAEIPHRYLKSAADETFDTNVLGRVSLPRKLSDDPVQIASTRAVLHRNSIAQMNIQNCSIQDLNIYGDPTHVPVVLVEQHVMDVPMLVSSRKSSFDSWNQNSTSEIHPGQGNKVTTGLHGTSLHKSNRILKIIIFVHGFQGHHLDLRLIRNQWLLLDPTAECLMSEANEEKTTGDFREMGNRLADEVCCFLKKKLDKVSRLGGCRDIRLSFVGHSIGNIIIRSALTESVMGPFLKHLHTFMSLSGPHLGYWYSSNSLFNSGLWLLKKLKGAQCIHQLTFTDDPDLQNTFFYKLCKQKTLENFKNIILLSSPQDGYVPFHSARIELCPASSWDNSKKAQVFMEMLNNCLDQIRAPSSECRTFMRCDINFDMSSQGRSLNTIIGRAAHIEFLETDIFARFIMWSYPELFR